MADAYRDPAPIPARVLALPDRHERRLRARPTVR